MIYDLAVLSYAKNYLPIFTELEGKHNIHLISPPWSDQKKLLHFLLQMEFAYKNGMRLLGENVISADASVCYLFFRDWYPLFANGYVKRLKELNPHTKACWFFSDLVDSYPGINIEHMQGEFDLILSFDPEDAERYNFVHCPLPYSALPQGERWQKEKARNDIFFIGAAKQRLNMILAVYERLRNADLNCDFHIVGVPLREQRYADEINYCTFLPYIDCLHMALHSRCILELLQNPTHHGFTARTGEALVYGRKLLSNNTHLISAPFYDQRQIEIFTSPDEININFIMNEWQPTCQPVIFSPCHTLKLIEERLNISFG